MSLLASNREYIATQLGRRHRPRWPFAATAMTQAGGGRLAIKSRAIASDIRGQGRGSADTAPHDPSATNDSL